MIKQVLGICLLLFAAVMAYSQNPSGSVSGNVKDALTGEDLIGATVMIKSRNTGVASNGYGYYSLVVPRGEYEMEVRYMGYETSKIKVTVSGALHVDIKLQPSGNELRTVEVSSRKKDDNIRNVEIGMEKLNVKDIKTIPVLFGEKDVLKTIQLMPGIKSEGEGSSGIIVRGGSADQNQILLDEANVYNASHMFGFFSVFNSDAIKSLSIYKGNEPAEYGGRLSSVLDIKMNDGNNQKMSATGGIGLISSRLSVEGPLVKDKGSFIVSGRRTYADLFLKLSNNADTRSSSLYFYDLNAKANYKLDDRNRIFLSGYLGQDAMGIKAFGIDWGNKTATLRWNHLWSEVLFSNTSVLVSDYLYKIDINAGSNLHLLSRILDYGLKQDFQLSLADNQTLQFGWQSTYHKIIPGAVTSSSDIDMKSLSNKNTWENALYLSHKLQLGSHLDAEYGFRLSSFSLFGPGNIYRYDDNGKTLDTTYYAAGRVVKSYLNLEPRLSLNYVMNDNNSVKAAYARNVQNLHLLSNSSATSPTDMWIPSSNNVKPEIADQVSVGYFRNFANNRFEFSVEAYYKAMQNQIDYRNGAQVNFNENAESQILFGKGRAYGLEMYLKKKYGRLNGWISYTLSRTERKFSEINNNSWYPSRQDRTHDVSIVGMYELNKHWSLSATWVYNTGNAVTFPTGKYEIDGKQMFVYSDRNANRMPAYHRLDLGATWMLKKTATTESSWSFSLYNAYGRENAYMITFKQSDTDPNRTVASQISLFRFIPSVSYNFKF